MKIHIVQKGDTLWKIAQKYGVDLEELKKVNAQLSNPDKLMPGMKIKVPTGSGSVKPKVHISGQKEEQVHQQGITTLKETMMKPKEYVAKPKEEMIMPPAPVIPAQPVPMPEHAPLVEQPTTNKYYTFNTVINPQQQQPQQKVETKPNIPQTQPTMKPNTNANPQVQPITQPSMNANPQVQPTMKPNLNANPQVQPITQPSMNANPQVQPITKPNVNPLVSPAVMPGNVNTSPTGNLAPWENVNPTIGSISPEAGNMAPWGPVAGNIPPEVGNMPPWARPTNVAPWGNVSPSTGNVAPWGPPGQVSPEMGNVAPWGNVSPGAGNVAPWGPAGQVSPEMGNVAPWGNVSPSTGNVAPWGPPGQVSPVGNVSPWDANNVYPGARQEQPYFPYSPQPMFQQEQQNVNSLAPQPGVNNGNYMRSNSPFGAPFNEEDE